VDAERREAQLARYKAGTDLLESLLDGATERELDARPGPEEWTAREVVHHLADSEMRAAIRLRQLIAEDDPVIQGYDEKTYTKALHYERPVGSSLAAAIAARRASEELLSALTPAEWERSGTHTESGPYGVGDWLEIYASHPHDHADQIARARSSAG
jgi:DinB family protein